MTRFLLGLAAFALFAPPLAAAQPVTGRWITEERDSVVEIAPCGAQLCGSIARFLIAPPGGLDQRDINNKEPAKRSRKLLGMMILSGFVADGDVYKGRIYDPRNGRTYRSVLRRVNPTTLEVKGCFGPICKSFRWAQAR